MRNIILILLGFIFLVLWLIVGYPFEISNLKADRLLTLLISFLIAGLIFMIFRLVTRIKSKIIRIDFLILLMSVQIFFPYYFLKVNPEYIYIQPQKSLKNRFRFLLRINSQNKIQLHLYF